MNNKYRINQGILAFVIAGLSTFAHADDTLNISTKGGLKISTEDGDATFTLGGRLQWDYDDTSVDNNPSEETFEVRRARIYVAGTVSDWGYKAQFNLGEEDGGSAEDLYITYNGWGSAAKVTIGRHKEPFGLENQTSSKDISLLERSAATEQYAPGRNAGVQLSGKSNNNLFYAVGLYRDDAEDDESIAETALTGRVAYAPFNESGKVLHLGLSYRAGEEDDTYALEIAGVLGQFHAQAEYFDADEADEDSSYAQIGYVISGTPRPYKNGAFKRVKPTDGWGVEVALRAESGVGRYSDIGLDTEEGEQLSLGLNLYPNSNVRLGLSYMTGETDSSDNDGDEIRFRTQLTF